LAGTPIFLGCSEADFHIPKERVIQSAEVLRRLGADVTMRLYPNLGHTVNQDELDAVKDIVGSVIRLPQV
jgi:predicted esterase